MFSSARWRLTLWFGATMALVLLILGVSIYLTTRHLLLSNLDNDLQSRATREIVVLAGRLRDIGRSGGPVQGVQVGPEEGAGGYVYALIGPDGQPLAWTANVQPSMLPGAEAVERALREGPLHVTTSSRDGEPVRLYLRPVTGPRGQGLVLAVGRSQGPEMAALRRLLSILVIGGGAGVLLALGGGYFLAGRALRPISEAMERQRTFVADASHELRTPLSLIRASAELVRRHPEEPVGAHLQSLDDIVAESDRLGHLVGQLLTLARADAGRLQLKRTEVDLTALVADVLRQLRPRAEARGLRLEMQAPGPLPVQGDVDRLREVALVLLDNALRYSDDGGAVRLFLSGDGRGVRLAVADDGPGIDPRDLPHIFERFYRADRARSREDGGAGLGLAIAKALVEAHGGRIWVESRPGQGATFVVELPAGG